MRKYQATSTLEILQDAKSYNRWIAETFLKYLSSPVLEIGAGIGNLTEFFCLHTPYHISDYDRSLLQEIKKKLRGKKGVYYHHFDITKKPAKKLQNKFASVIGINVLEHIDDDKAALKNVLLTLKPKGKILLLLPAKKYAYTRFDKEIGHYRRYEKEELRQMLEQAGCKINSLYFFNIVGLLSWVIRDRVERKNIQMKGYQIALFDSIVPLLRLLESKIKPAAGVSLIVIATKKA